MRAPASPSERAKHQVYAGAKGFKLRFKSDEASTEKEEPFVPVNEANAAQYVDDSSNSKCCKDLDSQCCSWALKGQCDSDANVRTKCLKACGFCGCKSKTLIKFEKILLKFLILEKKFFVYYFSWRNMRSENQRQLRRSKWIRRCPDRLRSSAQTWKIIAKTFQKIFFT